MGRVRKGRKEGQGYNGGASVDRKTRVVGQRETLIENGGVL